MEKAANHCSGRALSIGIETQRIDLHDHFDVIELQEEVLLGESEGAVARRDYPLLGNKGTGGRGLPGLGPLPPGRGEPGGAPHGETAVAQQRTGAYPEPQRGPSSSLRRLKNPYPVDWDPLPECPHGWMSATIGRAAVRRLAVGRVAGRAWSRRWSRCKGCCRRYC